MPPRWAPRTAQCAAARSFHDPSRGLYRVEARRKPGFELSGVAESKRRALVAGRAVSRARIRSRRGCRLIHRATRSLLAAAGELPGFRTSRHRREHGVDQRRRRSGCPRVLVYRTASARMSRRSFCSNEKSLQMTVLDSLVRGAHCLSIDTGTDSASSLQVVGEVALVVVAGPASYLSYRQVGGP